jgi:nicotinamidase-related amidase
MNTPNNKVGLDALLTPQNCVVVLIDHQPFQFANTRNMEPTLILNNTVGLAKAAKAFKVPTILTTVTKDRGGDLPRELQAVFPDQVPIDRTTLNSWEDPRVVDAVKKTGRKKIVFAALWTEICLAYPAIHAMGDGYDVYVVTDASGGVSVEAHDRAIQRLVQAGAVPVTWAGVMSEWQRDWARTETVGAVAEIVLAHCGSTGTSLAWETQLLASAHSAKK